MIKLLRNGQLIAKTRTFLSLCKYIVFRFFKDDCPYRATALTFTTLLSLVPFMVISLSVMAAFPIFASFVQSVENFIFTNFVPATGNVLQIYFQQFAQKITQFSAIGLIFLFITAILMMHTIERAMNTIWRVTIHRRGLATILLYWSVLTFSPIFIGMSIAISSYLWSFSAIAGAATTLGLTQPLLEFAPFMMSFLAFSLLYIVVPNCYVPKLAGMWSGLFAAILFELSKYIFGLYVTYFPSYQLLYGTLSVIPLFFFFFYIFWRIVLLGAVISHVVAMHYYVRQGKPLHPFLHAYRWLHYFWNAQKQGKSLTLPELIAHDRRHYEIEPDEQLSCLLKVGIIQVTQEGTYILCRDLSSLTLLELYHLLPWKFPCEHDFSQAEQHLRQLLIQAENSLHHLLDVPIATLYDHSGKK